MKTVFILLLSATFGLLCCHPVSDPAPASGTGNQPTPVVLKTPGTSMPVGQLLGTPTSKSIGPDGGTLATADGQVTLTIPAGALKGATTISIQPITNTIPSRVGNGFRLSPDGQTFAKPVTLTLGYEPDSLSSGQPQVLRIAYQDKSGIWQALPGATVNERSHTVSVPTPHFTDFSLFEAYSVRPSRQVTGNSEYQSVIGYGEYTAINVYQATDSLLANLVEGVAEAPARPSEISNWKLEGDGALEAKGNMGTYRSPQEIEPRPNPVVISVEVKPKGSTGKLILYTRVKVTGNAMELTLNGTKYKLTTASAANYGKGYMISAGSYENKIAVTLMTTGNGGGFGDLEKSNKSFLGVTTRTNTYSDEYYICKKPDNTSTYPAERRYSQGSATVNEENSSAGTFVTGSFSGQVVNEKRPYCYDNLQYASVSGTFRIKIR